VKSPQTIATLISGSALAMVRAGLKFAHHSDNALDEARELVLHALSLPKDLPEAMASAKVLSNEVRAVKRLLSIRIKERMPAAYLIGSAQFAGLVFKSDARALVPRSPIAELIEGDFVGFERARPWRRALDMCTGSGVIGLALAIHQPELAVDLVDISASALSLARENLALHADRHALGARVSVVESNLFEALGTRRYELIVSNPPYVTEDEYAALEPEYGHEPALGLVSGADGLDLTLKILAQACEHLEPHGWLIVEVGEAHRTLSSLLPELPLHWVKFAVGHMGVFAIRREQLMPHLKRIRTLLEQRG
jgi:ribosomal protein L3 glutamine methyltransferase